MKKKISAALLIMAVLTGYTIYAQPGDSGDPLVSKSYVDARISEALQIIGQVSGGTESVSYDIDEITAQTLERLEYLINSESTQEATLFVPVNAKFAQTIYGGESCEIILRSGDCVVKTVGENGITDLTSGSDLKNSDTVTQNHHLLIPRDDGRGLVVTTDEAWFLIKGPYTIKD